MIIPNGWRELYKTEPVLKGDRYNCGGEWKIALIGWDPLKNKPMDNISVKSQRSQNKL